MSMFRHLVSGKVRSNAGCWTCRLRRKKCDEQRPQCEGCRTLEITCYFDEGKPDWMDGGPRQKAMAEKIKAQVKKQASQRRDRKYMEMLESGTANVQLGADNEQPQDKPTGSIASVAENHDPGTSETDPSSATEMGTEMSTTPPSSNNSNGASPPETSWHNQLNTICGDPATLEDSSSFCAPEGSRQATSTEVHFIMIYLDYVFPYLFPFYRPHVLAGGRGWVLDVLQSNKSVWHTAVSLASYFFSVVMANGEQQHEACTDRMVFQLQTQLEKGLRELQREMRAVTGPGTSAPDRHKLQVLQGILQMVVFEVSTGNRDNWRMHVDAAMHVFQQLIPDPETWPTVLLNLYSLVWPPPEMGVKRPFSTDQAALRFFTANILYIDVMASITLERTPRLSKYQNHVIPSCKQFSKDPQYGDALRMEEFTGHFNWVVQMLGDIAELDAWKKQQIRAGSLSMDQLVERGNTMEQALQAGLCALEKEHATNPHIAEVDVALTTAPVTPGLGKQAPVTFANNIVWLHAALLYLQTVLYGWQPTSPSIRHSVSRMMDLLGGLPTSTCLKSLVWPFCISGCLALPEDEDRFRAMVQKMGVMKVFGTANQAMAVMDAVWNRRDRMDETWGVAKCLRVLGHPVLLI